MGVPNSNPLMGSRNRDHTVCFIVALIRCNADTPVLTNRAVLRMPVPFCSPARICSTLCRSFSNDCIRSREVSPNALGSVVEPEIFEAGAVVDAVDHQR